MENKKGNVIVHFGEVIFFYNLFVRYDVATIIESSESSFNITVSLVVLKGVYKETIQCHTSDLLYLMTPRAADSGILIINIPTRSQNCYLFKT